MIQVNNSIVARPKPTVKSAADGKPSVADNLETTNKAMLTQIKADVLEFTQHPLQSLKTMATGMAFPLAHPIITAKSLAQGIQEDGLEGSIAAAGTASGVAFIGTVLAIGLGVLAAPLTGGASLAFAATAASLTTPIAVACLAVDGAGVLLHEVRGAMADSADKAQEEGQNLTGYVEDAALNVATWVVGDAVQAKFFKAPEGGVSLTGAIGDAANNAIGLAGVYDIPTAGASVPAPAPRPVPTHARPHMAAHTRSDRFELSPGARQALGLV
ncbi:MAG TPA: hypothetical protein V6D05_05055 [Stenomitos sp.]